MRVLFRLSRTRRQRTCKFMAVSLSTSAKASAKVYLQILGTETRDTTPSLFLFADSQRCVDLNMARVTVNMFHHCLCSLCPDCSNNPNRPLIFPNSSQRQDITFLF